MIIAILFAQIKSCYWNGLRNFRIQKTGARGAERQGIVTMQKTNRTLTARSRPNRFLNVKSRVPSYFCTNIALNQSYSAKFLKIQSIKFHQILLREFPAGLPPFCPPTLKINNWGILFWWFISEFIKQFIILYHTENKIEAFLARSPIYIICQLLVVHCWKPFSNRIFS